MNGLQRIVDENVKREILQKYSPRINQLMEQVNLYLKDFACVVCGHEHFDITKEWKCPNPKCGETYDMSTALRVDMAEQLCAINTEIMKALYPDPEEYDLMEQYSCKEGVCPLEGDCPLEAV